MKNKLRTFSGRLVDPTRLTPRDVDSIDIWQGLSKLCRFSGQCNRFYSVREHSDRVASIIRVSKYRHLEIAALYHDASEAYLVDIPSPFKYKLKLYLKWELRAMHAIFKALQIPWPSKKEWKIIKKADKQALREEKKELF